MKCSFEWTGKAVPINRRTLLAKGERRVMTNPSYQRFVDEMAWNIKAQCPATMFNGELVKVTYTQYGRFDIDALEKPLLDAIERSRMIDNDRQVVEVHKYRKKGTSRLVVEVELL